MEIFFLCRYFASLTFFPCAFENNEVHYSFFLVKDVAFFPSTYDMTGEYFHLCDACTPPTSHFNFGFLYFSTILQSWIYYE